jgi:SAM-dependent methyltransferase
MTWQWILLGLATLATLAALAALFYWQLIIAEGTYLGPGVVARTYDWVAGRYDGIKQFRTRDEEQFVARPLLQALEGVQRPLVLDVATGTGRLPLALLRSHYAGQIVALDLSRGMLRQARAKLAVYGDQVSLVWQDARHLPFDDGSFDAVACLESLEFMPRPLETLAEMVRVLAPGGALMLTNRVGYEARLLPGRVIPREVFREELGRHGLRDVEVWRWQVNYDLARARKDGARAGAGRGGVALEALLRCPACGGRLAAGAASVSCAACGRGFSVSEGLVALVPGGG